MKEEKKSFCKLSKYLTKTKMELLKWMTLEKIIMPNSTQMSSLVKKMRKKFWLNF